MSRQQRYERLLVPTDGSEAAEAAIEHALAIAVDHEATIHAVYVIDSRITMAADDGTRSKLEETLRTEGERAIDRIVERARAANVESVASVERGTPSKEILEYVADAGIDLIVMGSAGKSPREKLIGMGSVSERVVDKAAVPVLVVPDDREEA